MTIQDKRTTVENKLVGAEKLYRIFNHTHYFLCGCASIGLFPVWDVFSTRMIVTVGFICLAFISRLLAKLFKSVKEEALEEMKNIDNLKSWVFTNN